MSPLASKMTPEPVAVPVPVWPVVGSVAVTPSATIVTTAGLTALTMSTTGAWLPLAALPPTLALLWFWLAGCWAVEATGAVVDACAVALTRAYVPPDASSDDASTAPTTNTGPTVRLALGAGLGASGVAGAANGLDVVGDGA